MTGSQFERIEHLPVNVAVVDAGGIIVGVNERWKQFGRDNSFAAPAFGVGASYLDICARSFGRGSKVVRDLTRLLSGGLRVLTFVYPCHSPTERRWFMLLGLPVRPDRPSGAALVHVDVTALVPGVELGDEATMGLGSSDAGAEPDVAVPMAEFIAATLERSVEKVLTSVLARNAGRLMRHEAGPEQAEALEAYERVQRVLSKRQMEVLLLIGEGKSNSEIAEALATSQNTVKLHVSAVLKKLQLSSRTQAALLASRLRRPF